MSSGETRLWNYLRPRLKRYGHFERIESHETSIGTPDVSYCIRGYCNNLELKYTEKDEGGFKLRPAQAAWFRKRVKAKGQPWLLLHAKIDGKNGYFLVPGASVPALLGNTRVIDWMNRSAMAWEDKLNVEQLATLLGTYLITEPKKPSSVNRQESSGLILPSHLQKN